MTANPEEKDPTTKATILIVDDSSFVRTSVVLVLKKEGYNVIEASNGFEAIEKAVSTLPALIMMDLSMPGMDGFKAVEALRANEKTKDTPVIIVTAHATKEHVIKSKQLGIGGFLVKPFDIDEIIKVAKKYVP